MARDPERGPDPDDWFAGADDADWPPPQGAAIADSDALPPAGTTPSDDWLDDGDAPVRPAIGQWSTTTKLAVAGVLLVIALVLGLLLGGVFESDNKQSSTPPTTAATTTHPATTTEPTTTTTPKPTVTVPTAQLAFGDRGAEVTQLQRALAAAGYQVGTIDGVYGPDTKAAVEKFQADESLKADGIAGPDTLAALEAKVNGG